jgi:UDP-glucose 4-epimerase
VSNPSQILIAGATGFIGSAAVAHLIQRGHRVHALCFSARGQLTRLPAVEGLSAIEVESDDPGALGSALARLRPDVVIDATGAGVSVGQRSPLSLVEGNVGLPVSLVLAAAAANVRSMIRLGSWLEYALSAPGRPITEDYSLATPSLYGASKAAGTIMTHAVAGQHGLPLVTLRLFHVFGPGEPPNRLSQHLIARLRAGQSCDLTSGEQVRDMVYISDAVAAIVRAAEVPLGRPVYNVCSGRGVTVREFAERIADGMQRPRDLLRFGQLPQRPDEHQWLVGDGSMLRADTGWHPRFSLEDSLTDMLKHDFVSHD